MSRNPRRPLLGSHVSIAGGVENAPARGEAVGCDTIQIFTKSNVQWRAARMSIGSARLFREGCEEKGLRKPFGHTSYLINLAAGDREIYRKSINSLGTEVRRAERLGLFGLVLHPGSHGGDGIEAGIERVVRALDQVHKRTPCFNVKILLETTSGQGAALGARFEELAAILQGVRDPDRLGFCFDTCHVFSAGYDTRTRKAYLAAMRELDKHVGLERVLAFHLNDSKRDLGSRVDRHAHIGEGMLGLEPFRCLLNDRRFADRPMVLETPKDPKGENDRKNLATLRSLLE
jgi:deoxyribonuclease-4